MKNNRVFKIIKREFNTTKEDIYYYIKKYNNTFMYLMAVFIGLLFSFWVFKAGLIKGDDLFYHLSRIKGLEDSIKIGDFRALIHIGMFGYGYANGIFYGNLLLYIPAISSIFIFDTIDAYKLYIVLCNIGSALTMYWCIKGITKSKNAALLGSFLYSACSYKACDFIIRAAGGEMGAFVFLPLVVLGLYYIIYEDYKKWWILSIGFIGLIQCHLISSVLCFAFIIVIIIINWERFFKEKKRIIYLVISGIVGLLIGAHFIFPLIEGLIKNTLYASTTIDFKSWKYSVPFERLFLAYPYSTSKYYYPPGIGILYLVLISLRFRIKSKKNDNVIKFCDLSIILGISSLLLATDIFPWQDVKFIRYIQFPWRFYLFASLFLVISSTITTYYYLKNKNKKDIIKFIIPILIIAFIPTLIIENKYRDKHLMLDIHNWNVYDVGYGEYLPKDTSIYNLYYRRYGTFTNHREIKTKAKKHGNSFTIKYKNNSFDDSYIDVPLLYYYGYVAEDSNGEQLKISKGYNNIIRVKLNKKADTIKVYYKGTLIQDISLWISIISTLILIYYLYINRKELFKL